MIDVGLGNVIKIDMSGKGEMRFVVPCENPKLKKEIVYLNKIFN
jgi:hypothetical protein